MKKEFSIPTQQRSPVVPFFGEEIGEDYKDDEYLNVLCELLKGNAPDLLSRFKYIVIESSNQWMERKKELKELEEERFELIGKIQCQEEKLDYYLTQLPEEPTENKWQMLLTAGLAVFMVVGVAKLFNKFPDDLIRINQLQNAVVLAISLIAATAINIAERKAVENHVKYTFDSIRQSDTAKSEGNSDTDNSKLPQLHSRKPAWNPAIYVAVAILLCETAFVSLGFMSTPDFSSSQTSSSALENIAIIAASALAGLVNIALAWGSALQRATWERENFKKRKEIVESHFSDDLTFSSKEQLYDLEKRIEKKEREVERDRELSVEEHARFSEDLSERLMSKVFGVDEPIHSHVGRNQYVS